jgi:hypothetical protein
MPESHERVFRYNVLFKKEIFDRIEKFCAATGVKPNDYVRRCVELAAGLVETETLAKPEVRKHMRGVADLLALHQNLPPEKE